MATDAELDVLVEQAEQTIRERGDNVNTRNVLNLVKHRAEDVLRAYQRLEDRQRAMRAAELSQAISPIIAKELIKDRDAYADAKTQTLKSQIEQLHDNCGVLQEKIAELRSELSETQEQSAKEQLSLTDMVNSLQQIKTSLEGEIHKHLGEIKILTIDRDKARQERHDAEARRSGLQSTLAVKSESERRERARSNKIQRRLDESMIRIEDLEKQVNSLEKRKSSKA